VQAVAAGVKQRIEATCGVTDEDDRRSQVRPFDEYMHIRDVALKASATTRASVAATDASAIECAKPDIPEVTTDTGPGLRRDSQAAVGQHDGASAAARDTEVNVRSNLDRRRKAVRSALRGSTRRAPSKSE
jgi:hypothetical protein